MDFLEHLGELRRRIFYVFIGILLGAIFAFLWADQIFQVLAEPYQDGFPNEALIGTGPAEAFILKLKVSAAMGFVVSSPWWLFQLWLFISPGLHENEKKLALPFVFVTTLLFLGGILFAYKAVMPFAFDFFYTQYQSVGLKPTVRMSEHCSLLLRALLGFGVVFELPVIAFFLARVGLLREENLRSGFRYAIIIIFIISAVLTPPDIFTQFLMAGPLLVLYGISIYVVRWAEPAWPEEQPGAKK